MLFKAHQRYQAKLALFALALTLVNSVETHATDVSWGTEPLSTLLQSDGSALDSSFNFEIGYFSNIGGNPLTPFIPTSTNLGDWSTYWVPWDVTNTTLGQYNPAIGYVTRTSTFNGTSTSNVSSLYGQTYTIPDNAQGYLWVYDSKAVNPNSEWALITNLPSDLSTDPDWRFPAASDALTPSPGTLDWRYYTAGTAILGGFSDTQGPGTYTSSPTAFALQTSAVPEPGSALLVMMTGFALQIVRRRNRWRHSQ